MNVFNFLYSGNNSCDLTKFTLSVDLHRANYSVRTSEGHVLKHPEKIAAYAISSGSHSPLWAWANHSIFSSIVENIALQLDRLTRFENILTFSS